jgi:monoamine oxidase
MDTGTCSDTEVAATANKRQNTNEKGAKVLPAYTSTCGSCECKEAYVHRWGKDRFSRGAYSYVPVGASGRDYDLMAASVAGRVYFAGEATNRKHPVTVAGAYLSGIREACAIHDAYMNAEL